MLPTHKCEQLREQESKSERTCVRCPRLRCLWTMSDSLSFLGFDHLTTLWANVPLSERANRLQVLDEEVAETLGALTVDSVAINAARVALSEQEGGVCVLLAEPVDSARVAAYVHGAVRECIDKQNDLLLWDVGSSKGDALQGLIVHQLKASVVRKWLEAVCVCDTDSVQAEIKADFPATQEAADITIAPCDNKACTVTLPEAQLKKCAGCNVRQYCSRACQVAAWKSGHQRECAIFKRYQSNK
jgi:hypothetical protein